VKDHSRRWSDSNNNKILIYLPMINLLTWEHILPALKSDKSATETEENIKDQAKNTHKIGQIYLQNQKKTGQVFFVFQIK